MYVVGEVGIQDELDLVGIKHIGGPADGDKKISLKAGEFMEHDHGVGAVVVGFNRYINYYKLQVMASLSVSPPELPLYAGACSLLRAPPEPRPAHLPDSGAAVRDALPAREPGVPLCGDQHGRRDAPHGRPGVGRGRLDCRRHQGCYRPFQRLADSMLPPLLLRRVSLGG